LSISGTAARSTAATALWNASTSLRNGASSHASRPNSTHNASASAPSALVRDFSLRKAEIREAAHQFRPSTPLSSNRSSSASQAVRSPFFAAARSACAAVVSRLFLMVFLPSAPALALLGVHAGELHPLDLLRGGVEIVSDPPQLGGVLGPRRLE